MNLQEWLIEIERKDIFKYGYVRCYTDEQHGRYVDVYKDYAEDQDGSKWTLKEDVDYIKNILIPDFRHGFDGNEFEFNMIMGI
jgi:hypothetical protein